MATRRRRLQGLFVACSALTALLLLSIAIVSLRSIAASHRAATDAARADLRALEDAGELQGMFYQKGFVASYVLSGDERWLDELDQLRGSFDAWLARTARDPGQGRTGEITAELVAEYGMYDRERAESIALFRRGDPASRAAAIATMPLRATRTEHLRDLANQIIALRREDVNARLAAADRSWHRALIALGVASLVAVLAAAFVGWVLALRVARPLYELVLRAESAAGGALVEVQTDDEIGALSEHVRRLAREIEASSSALSEQRVRLAQAEKMSALGEMATAVAHEVLNPLTGVKTAMQLLARTQRSPEVTETASLVDAEVRRVEQMARRLMSFARPLSPSVRACDMDEILPRVLAAAQAAAAENNVRIEPGWTGAATLHADPDLLSQVLINLTVNACQAMCDGGTVRISLRRDHAFQVIDVSDDGPGLADSVRARLYAPFVTTRSEGHGLGLAISQGIALAHGGRLEAHDRAPQGTIFSLFIPGPRQ